MLDILKSLLITFLFFVVIGLIFLFALLIAHLCKLYPTVMGWIGIGLIIAFVVLLVFGVVYSMISGDF